MKRTEDAVRKASRMYGISEAILRRYDTFFIFGDRMVKYGRCQGVPNEVTHDVWSKDFVLYIKSHISDKIALMAFFQKDVGHHAIQDGY